MNKITSFTINHLKLLPGVYVSRKDKVGDNVLTTFDLRITRPNYEPVMNTAEIHTIEHLGATYLRNNFEWGDKTIYFGPKDCGNYLDLNLYMAKFIAAKYYDILSNITPEQLVYPE